MGRVIINDSCKPKNSEAGLREKKGVEKEWVQNNRDGKLSSGSRSEFILMLFAVGTEEQT
jgi:hypothetical protein